MPKKNPENNPFVHSLEIKGVWKLDFEHKTKLEGNESSVTYAQSRLIDGDDRVSVYGDGLLNWFTPLSSSAKDMFMYIAIHLGYQRDVIELNEDDYCKLTGIGRTTFYKAKAELTNRLIVPRLSRRNTYWVNPSYLFKGSRIDKYPGCVIQSNENPLKHAEEQSQLAEPEAPYLKIMKD